jgi:hypothetical protein
LNDGILQEEENKMKSNLDLFLGSSRKIISSSKSGNDGRSTSNRLVIKMNISVEMIGIFQIG